MAASREAFIERAGHACDLLQLGIDGVELSLELLGGGLPIAARRQRERCKGHDSQDLKPGEPSSISHSLPPSFLGASHGVPESEALGGVTDG